MKRRKFLKTLGVGAGLVGVPYFGKRLYDYLSEQKLQNGILLGAAEANSKHYLSYLDLDHVEEGSDFYPVNFKIHGIAFHPKIASQMAFFEKKGPGGCVFNLKEPKRVHTLSALPGHHFYGHGCFSKSGDTLFCTENDLSNYQGKLVVRDGKDFSVLGSFPTYGLNPHDCQLVQDGSVLAVTNGGGDVSGKAKGSVSFIDIQSQKLLDHVEVGAKHLNAGHFALSSQQDLVIISAPRDGLDKDDLGGVSFRKKDSALKTTSEPAEVVKKMKSEALSVAINESRDTVAVTHPEGGMITFWDLSGNFKRQIDIAYPRGVALTLDKKHFIVSHGRSAGLVFVSTRNLELMSESNKNNLGFTGSHLFLRAPTPSG